ncbi:MAG: PilZ domain-containing protein [Myxococcota bacterium]
MTGRRVHERYTCDLPVTLVTESGEITRTASNISLGGMYLEPGADLPYGTTGTLRFRVPALKEDANVDVVVRWIKPEGIGLQFGSLRAIEVWALNQYFKSLQPAPLPE